MARLRQEFPHSLSPPAQAFAFTIAPFIPLTFLVIMRVIRGYQHPLPQPTVLTLGNFDGVHLGHRALLRALKESGAALQLPTAVLTFEPHPREFFDPGDAPARLSVLREKLAMFAAMGIDHVCVCPFNQALSQLSAEAFIDEVLLGCLRVKHLIVGDDFRFGARRQGDFHHLQVAGQQHGFSVTALDSVDMDGLRVSSSAVRTALAAGEMQQAARLLGRPYLMHGRVVHGDKVGRKMGFATANIRVKHLPLPLAGVFAVRVTGLGTTALPAVANLGTRPTAGGMRTLLEVHLFDFDADIYGQHLCVEFCKKLRAEKRFADFAQLQAQIARDAAEARSFFGI